MNTHPPFDVELAAFLPEGEPDRPFLDGVEGVERLRAAMAEYEESVDDVRAATGARIDERTVDGVPVIVILPAGDRRARGAILNVHGGGLVAGSHRSVLTVNTRIALDLDCAMVVPDYRLAPEHPYPAGLDDVHTVWRWLAGGGLWAEVDPDRLVVMGGSAGGLLSAGLMVRLLARRETLPSALALVQPQLDDRNAQPSTYEIEHAHFWDRPSNLLSWSMYLAGVDGVPDEASPARVGDLRGFPPTFIEIGQVDVFRDEELDFAARLSRAGVPVEAHLWAGAFHGFDGLTETRTAQRAVAARLDFLRGYLSDR
ncbi:alpha/beta hydrolase [Microbacterium sp. ASV49]|uniref:Alpha/beta hydrolase n=1 Tax=Microbacterium candidum TaxID=3041922 RepID=A0ABT7MWC1_9MICO|nr:alpha/beta hydrolase [Microbacterium sp. ASV49]MDL9978736.1 alpha/beta hydrolase [Microbacterium sp. ASV49]